MYTTLNHRSPVQWLVRKGVWVLPTACNEAVTSKWRSADILV
ncbi:rCG62289 [Rattus norvegicus]|uniref:RCG62289 n=1 Tax=Rattus norvegicus TaxID=10116 RepID=A6HB28_RAT|nr:rCG62289 [Rattus norvegicus]